MCKLLNLVPRHQLIVGRILGHRHAFLFTKIIGALEVLMSAWIVSGIFSPLCAIIQIAVITLMNVIEFVIASDLLLFRKGNIVIAMLLCAVIYINAFIL
ncbi:MAG TPA: DoxX-like family protein [Parafilimonas sp.]|nr:DoxX-like family protein [Parafilimonas sp.]